MSGRDIRKLGNKKILVAPSLLAADFSRLAEEIRTVEQDGCDLLHLDVMDAHFVPNLTMGPPLLKSIRKTTNLIFDTHLMITSPLKYAGAFVRDGADHITFHVESADNPEDVIREIRKLGATVGMSLKPATPAEKILPFLDKIDLVLVMSVEPGFGGQSFMTDMMPKVREIRMAIRERSLPVHLEIDGGIDEKTVVVAAENGANMMVAGTSVFRNPLGAARAIEALRAAQKDFNKFK